jgi:glycosyltransferase involved in cell wall biosynthesis
MAREHEVRVIAPVAWTSGVRPPELPRIADGMAIHHPRYLFTPKVLRGWYGHFFAGSVRACFERQVREFSPDVVLGCWAYPDGWAAVRLAREAGLAVAIKVHGSDVLALPGGARTRRTAEALRSADAVITVSRDLRDKALAMGADASRVHVVYNGIDTGTFSPGSREDARVLVGVAPGEPLILFVGNLLPVKGPDLLVDALARIAGERFRCVCIGQGPMAGKLTSQIAARGLSSRISLIGPRPQSELVRWYRAADLFVLPSRSEGVPNVLLEAAACGTPYVATSVGGIPEISDPAALVRPNDALALAEHIRVFLSPATRPALAPQRRAGSWADSARALAAVLGGITTNSLACAA